MKKNKRGFTLVELIVVVIIISIISGSGVMYFSGFTENNDKDIVFIKLKNSIALLDKRIKNHDIFDYNIFFSTGSFYYYNINSHTRGANTYFKSFSLSGDLVITGELASNINSGGIFLDLGVYKKDKLFQTFSIASNTGQMINLSENDTYKIKTNIGDIGVGELGFAYFDDFTFSPKFMTKLDYISDKVDFNPKYYTGEIIMENNKKEFYLSGQKVDSLYLRFTKAGKQFILQLTK